MSPCGPAERLHEKTHRKQNHFVRHEAHPARNEATSAPNYGSNPINSVGAITGGTNPVPEPGQVAASFLLLTAPGGYVFLKRRKAANASSASCKLPCGGDYAEMFEWLNCMVIAALHLKAQPTNHHKKTL